ncbi:ribokinase [Vagococcus xieshaowenii]|uniref:Ribokinase n=1 Tax=Vagococcus xieshaowenii TaxID=2562451 RepID=A0AAJ5EGT4_9ENTE|nr:ribokinase [Vagococcus xieshaowenii]QCA28908.1 ribokinase [Vagococcus xieshaowenii]TFZ43326.1 ribokinase [Vagococcus xieshaowenii]
MKKVAVIGSLSTDFVVTTGIIPEQGETVVGEEFATFYGGKGANQAVAASRAGVQTYMFGAVGDDEFGQHLIDNLTNNQIDSSMIKVAEHTSSGVAIIQVHEGDNRIIIVEGSNSKNETVDIDNHAEMLKEMDLFIIQNEIPTDVIEYAIKFAEEAGIPVLYNPAPIKEISHELLEKITYITPNEHEFETLFQGKTLEQALAENPNKLIVTLGSKGAIYHNGEQAILVEQEKIDNVIDTTGAGDTFNGYFASGILTGLSIEEAIKLGNRASGIAIQKKGAQTGIPKIEEVSR